jgi:alpha-D-xyloside xylohydrolase
MAAELRGGLSFGLCGFSFWSHDVGGFTARADESLYLRWLSFGALTSHTRCHGISPKEPWEYGDRVMAQFRKIDEMKYKLMPYVYAQAKDCSERGLPMLRALFIEYPEDPGSWLVDNEYLFGSDMLVAPLFENAASRNVYLPPGKWIDYQSGKVYPAGWSRIEAGDIPAVILVRDGAAIPHIKLAQSTAAMDWSSLELVVFAVDGKNAQAMVCLPSDLTLHKLALARQGDQFRLIGNPLSGKVTWTIRQASTRR